MTAEDPGRTGVVLPSWVALLRLWSRVDEPRFRLTARCSGEAGAEWEGFVTAAGAAGLLDVGPEPDSYLLRPDALPLPGTDEQGGTDQQGDAETARRRLVDGWLAAPDPALLPEITAWAFDLRRWDAVLESWILFNEHPGAGAETLLPLYRDVPAEARRERPILTWASGAAGSVLGDRGEGEATGPAVQRLNLDSATLHADWASREDTDTAVFSGAMRMMGERRRPSVRPGEALDAAWRTKLEIDAFIDARSREGRGPGRRAHGLFRAFSGRVALARADAAAAIDESRWARLLIDREPVQTMAAGLERLALSVLREDPGDDAPPLQAIDHPLGVRGLRGMGHAYTLLAQAHRALRALDREGVDRALPLVEPGAAAIAGVWAVQASLQAFRDGLWGDVEQGLSALLAALAADGRAWREQDEPLGAALLSHARLMLLTKLGAFGVAGAMVGHVREPYRLVPLARLHLWSGDLAQALQVAEAGFYLVDLPTSDRAKLVLMRAAAALLGSPSDARARADAVRQVRTLSETGNFIGIATLPRAAREALLAAARAELEGRPGFDLLVTRLAGLNDAAESAVRAVRLTERERVLLPLLATDDPVPEIARKLQVSVNTVRKQVVTLREKFQADSRGELVTRARNHGALP